MNHLKTFILLAVLTALFGGLGYMIGGATGMMIALVLAGGMNLISYWNADKIVLKMYRAQPVDEQHPNAVVRTYVADVVQMARDAGLPRTSRPRGHGRAGAARFPAAAARPGARCRHGCPCRCRSGD